MKAPFDEEKIYQLISDVVDKTFVTVDEEDDPYVSVSFNIKRASAILDLGFRQRFTMFSS